MGSTSIQTHYIEIRVKTKKRFSFLFFEKSFYFQIKIFQFHRAKHIFVRVSDAVLISSPPATEDQSSLSVRLSRSQILLSAYLALSASQARTLLKKEVADNYKNRTLWGIVKIEKPVKRSIKRLVDSLKTLDCSLRGKTERIFWQPQVFINYRIL